MSSSKPERPDIPSEQEILDAVKRTGYLMDQEVATVLEDLGYHVQTSWPFEDSDKGESRELDVWAVQRLFQDEARGISLFVELFCECKGGEKRPFVFLSRRKGEIDRNVSPEHFVFPLKRYHEPINNGYMELKGFQHLKLADVHPWFQQDRKAVQFAKMVRDKGKWEAQHAGIYDAIVLPLAKALIYRIETLRTFTNPLVLCFPLVVLKSDIYEIDTRTKETQPVKIPYISFFRRFDAKSVKGDFLITFTTYEGLKDYISREVVPFAKAVAEVIQKDPSRILQGGIR